MLDARSHQARLWKRSSGRWLLIGLIGLAGCSDGDSTTGGAGGTTTAGTGGGGTSTGGTSTGGTSTGGTSTGGTTADGNDTFETAEALQLGTVVSGKLDPTGDVDLYAFQGTKGDAVVIFTTAQEAMNAFDPDTINTVITLYDANQQQIAENDNNPIGGLNQDSELITILPDDGTYYVKVWECWTWAAQSGAACSGPEDKLQAFYNLGTAVLDPSMDGYGSTTPAGEVRITSAADPLIAVGSVHGTDYTGAARLSPPLALGEAAHLWIDHPGPTAGTNDFYILLHGVSYSNPLETDDAGNDDPATAEPIFPDFSSPNSHFVEGDLDLAKMPSPDVDCFEAQVPPGTTKVRAACTAQRSGSGLRGLQVDVLYLDPADMMFKSVVTATESATQNLITMDTALPPTAAALVLKLTAQSQDPAVSSAFYRCGFHFTP